MEVFAGFDLSVQKTDLGWNNYGIDCKGAASEEEEVEDYFAEFCFFVINDEDWHWDFWNLESCLYRCYKYEDKQS
jgi:hypothetical protein